MNELTKRTLSGFVFVLLVVFSTIYSPLIFSILFAFFLIVGSLEFANLLSLNKKITVSISVAFYVIFSALGFEGDYFFEVIPFLAFVISSYLLYFLFYHRVKISDYLWIRYVLFLGYILFPAPRGVILVLIVMSTFPVSCLPKKRHYQRNGKPADNFRLRQTLPPHHLANVSLLLEQTKY